MDTPGLSDIKIQECETSAITEALKRDRSFQVVFVVTLSAGGLPPEDIATADITYDLLEKDNEKLKLLAPLQLFNVGHQFFVLLLLRREELSIFCYTTIV